MVTPAVKFNSFEMTVIRVCFDATGQVCRPLGRPSSEAARYPRPTRHPFDLIVQPRSEAKGRRLTASALIDRTNAGCTPVALISETPKRL